MGLDMYVLEIRKPRLNGKVYKEEELNSAGISFNTVEQFEKYADAVSQLMPYTQEVLVEISYYDTDKIKADYDLPDNAYIGVISYAGITMSGRFPDGTLKRAEISASEIKEKYIIVKTEKCYAWKREEVAYWRKHYELQSAFYEAIGDVENCGYYVLDSELINSIYEHFPDDMAEVPQRDPGTESALFYHEWY